MGVFLKKGNIWDVFYLIVVIVNCNIYNDCGLDC